MSFPGEHRKRVESIAETLAAKLGKEKILYDRWYAGEFARPNLDTYLQKLYHNESELLVFFFCEDYNKKEWCGLEWRAGRDLLKHKEDNRLMFARFDDADIPGIYSGDGYLDLRVLNDAQAMDEILKRLALLNPPTATSNKKFRAFTAKLPTVNTLLIGREDELKFLDEAWANPATNFVQIIAAGGTGKTALVDKWFKRHLDEATFFGWSFYSQGADTGHATSSDTFFAEIMGWLEIPPPSYPSVYAKAEAVANHLREQKVLLILDGIEPLQNPDGVLQDSALKALLQELSNANKGLVLCTTRVRLDIPDETPRAISLDLENLQEGFGAEYLRKLGVHGEQDELHHASRDCGNHALALTLLGTYLVDFMDADIRRRVEIRELMGHDVKYGPHAQRMMAAYERMFTGKPEAAILRALGFFNRPAEPEALKLVLPEMKELEYRAALNRLFAARLVLAKNPAEPVDCHPLIREHFAGVMRSSEPEAFKGGHSRLYEYYCKQAPEQPETLDEMAPLFYAVYHGCRANQFFEALKSAYVDRIHRGNRFYLMTRLGAFGSNLSLLSNFFETPWIQPVTTLPRYDQAWLLAEAGSTLFALGRLADALAPMRSAAEGFVLQKQWANAAAAHGNLSDLLLKLGHVPEAITAARQSVDFGVRSGTWTQTVSKKTTLAFALLQAGDLIEAQDLFTEAERMQSKEQPECPILYSLWGFHYCSLLLEEGENAEVIRRATQTLRWVEREHWPLDIGLDHLSLGRAYPSGSAESIHHLDQAVHFLRQSGHLETLLVGLLGRGTPHDLDEVSRIATRSGMRLHLTDYHLAMTRLKINGGNPAKAREHFEQAKKLIQETGYHRRDKQLEQLRTELG